MCMPLVYYYGNYITKVYLFVCWTRLRFVTEFSVERDRSYPYLCQSRLPLLYNERGKYYI